MLGVFLTQWTIRIALAFYVAALVTWLIVPRPRWAGIGRWFWTAGCGLFLAHVAFAFHFHHQWSHAAAWEDTAKETEALLGFAFGDGIYFSYAFTALWLVDVVWMWSSAGSGHPNRLRILIHLFLFFIAFNGAIIFEAGPTRWAGIPACLLLAGLAARWAYNWRRSPELTAGCERISLTSDS